MTMFGLCIYCSGIEEEDFCEERFGIYLCTRDSKHEGRHVACGEHEHAIKGWGEKMVTADG